MKKEFAILKHTPKITITVTRDSVCAADDCDAPHEKTVSLPSFIDPIDFIRELLTRYSLPHISGGAATWTCHFNGENIAVIAQQWPSPKAMIAEMAFLETNELHFEYHAQERPDNYV
jgi:hypothetical protein